jgi:cathepsin L
MFTLFLVFVILSFVAGKVKKVYDLDRYTFAEYMKEFRYSWKEGSHEFLHHLETFKSNVKEIIAHNKNPHATYKMGINKFTAFSTKDMRNYNGYSKSLKQAHKPTNLKDHNIQMRPVSDLPREVDWRKEGIVSAVKDQGHCGSCWAFGATGTLESSIARATGLLFSLSPQQIASCAPNPDSCGGTGGCMGGTAEIAFDYLAKSKGIQQSFQYPYTSYYGEDFSCNTENEGEAVAYIDGYTMLQRNNYTELMNAVATIGPIAISVDASTFGKYESGIYTNCPGYGDVPGSPDINHAVVLVGYGVDDVTGLKYWLIRNSWSPAWGESGYIRLIRSDNDSDNCAIDTTPEDGYACAGDHEPISVCGACGMLCDSSYPTGAGVVGQDDDRKP